MRYRVWAPRASKVELVFTDRGERVTMQPSQRGHYEVADERLEEGVRYAFSLDGDPALPDPRSRYQPQGVHGPSQWLALDTFHWSDSGFQQAPLKDALVYELHVGTFSEEGSFEGVLSHLDHLKRLGVTHVELMPVAAFPGSRGWGYDGVDWFAPHVDYGGPRGLMHLVNECHRSGFAVILDVVYNHMGPSGNYLSQYGPYFTNRYGTPWGEALNFDGAGSDEVRRFVCDNALHWLEHYHIDGLRLDAVHAIFDQSATHILEQLSSEVADLSTRLSKPLILVAESHLNDPRFVKEASVGGYGLTSQWSDDFHHALRTVLTGDKSGYYADYGRVQQLAESLRHGFVYRGSYSEHREHSYGREPHGLSGSHFHVFCQNHDQVGNRAMGDRLEHQVSDGQAKIAAALTLMSPFVPMLFMGQEWGASTPFLYFTQHSEPELAEAVRKGRREEFVTFGWDPQKVPDPQAESSYAASKLNWQELADEPHRGLLEWYSSLLRLRNAERALTDDQLERVRVDFDEQESWLLLHRGDISLLVNFADRNQQLDRERIAPPGTPIALLLCSDSRVELADAVITLPRQSATVVAKGR